MTKWDVLGRGKQQGVQVGGQLYDELAKSMLMMVIEDSQVEEAVQIIHTAASTGFPGDGRTFVSDVDAAYTLRDRAKRPLETTEPDAGCKRGPLVFLRAGLIMSAIRRSLDSIDARTARR